MHQRLLEIDIEHGVRQADLTLDRAIQFYDNSLRNCDRPPLRFVVFAWKSEAEKARVIPDYKIKSNDKWFANIGHQTSDDPYYLYAASNSGSLIALLSYPFLLEPTIFHKSHSLEKKYNLYTNHRITLNPP